MSSKAYYAAYNASPAGRARMQKFLTSPRRKSYRASYDDKHREQIKAYGKRYYAKTYKPVQVVVPCRSANCGGSFIRRRSRQFCDECRYAFGYHIKSRWWFKHKAMRAAKAA